MLSRLQILVKLLVSKVTGALQRLLVFLSLLIAVVGCVSFLYGVITENPFYCAVGVVGSVAFVYVNKQT
jgi:hypothetical protein